MRSRKIALALFACLALGAIATSAAQAAEGDGWTIEGSGLIPNGTHQSVECQDHGTSTFKFTSTLLGQEVELSAEGVDCVEAKIDNTTSKGHSEGKLTFTGVKVIKPSDKCGVLSPGGILIGQFTTAALTDEVIMDPTASSTVVFDRFFPEVAGGAFVTIEFVGAECPLNEAAAAVKGSACGESVHTNATGTDYEPNQTGELKAVQILLFGQAQQTTGNSFAKPCQLKFGTKTAQLAGAVDTSLIVTNVGKKFGVD